MNVVSTNVNCWKRRGPSKDVVVALMATLAKQERLRISERTRAGLKRAKREGKVLGRPRVNVDVAKVRNLRNSGHGLRGVAKKTGWSLSSIMRALRQEEDGSARRAGRT